MKIEVPRLRDSSTKREIPLESYAALRNTDIINANALNQILNGMSPRKYAKMTRKVPETFGIDHSTVSRRFAQASQEKLNELQKLDLSDDDIVSIFIGGKRFAENGVILALGGFLGGRKEIAGINRVRH